MAWGQRAQSGRDAGGHLDGWKMGRVGLAFLEFFVPGGGMAGSGGVKLQPPTVQHGHASAPRAWGCFLGNTERARCGGLLFRARFPRPAKAAGLLALLLALGLFDAGQALTQRGQLCGLAGNLAGLLTQPGGLVCELGALVCKLAGLAIHDAHLLLKYHEGLACCAAFGALVLCLFGAGCGGLVLCLFRLFRLYDGQALTYAFKRGAGLAESALGAAQRG